MSATVPRLHRPSAPQTERPLLLYLPGMDGTGRLFYRQIPGLQPYFDICCVELPQQGRLDWTALAEKTLHCLQAEQTTEARSVWLCGESFGACLALRLATLAPALVQQLILINPASSARQHVALRSLAPYLRYWPDWLQRNACWGLLPWLAELGRLTDRDRQALIAAMQSVPAAVASWRLELLGRFDVQAAQLRQLRQPTLLIAGARDRLLPSVAEVQRLAAALPQAHLAIRPDSGHACLLECDWQLADVLAAKDFLPAAAPMRTESVASRRADNCPVLP